MQEINGGREWRERKEGRVSSRAKPGALKPTGRLNIDHKISGLIHKLEREYPGFNKRMLAYADFESICNAKGIITWQDKIPWEGWYFVRNHFDFIVIKSALSDFNKRFTAFHELGHYFSHSEGHLINHNYSSRQKKLEFLADIIAAVALMPTSILEILESMHLLSAAELAEIFKAPEDFGELRLKIFKNAHI
jgi:Zn-dependent peptidase ImmA (M78 family)